MRPYNVSSTSNLNVKLKEKGLPDLSYRISADYGKVEMAKSLTSTSEDLFGPVVNLCSKINSKLLYILVQLKLK